MVEAVFGARMKIVSRLTGNHDFGQSQGEGELMKRASGVHVLFMNAPRPVA